MAETEADLEDAFASGARNGSSSVASTTGAKAAERAGRTRSEPEMRSAARSCVQAWLTRSTSRRLGARFGGWSG